MDPAYAATYERFEQSHWWFVARRRILCDLLNRYARPLGVGRWLDVGCGAGTLLEAFDGAREKLGIDVDSGLLERAGARGLTVRQVPETDLPDDLGTFELVTACDVIEHIADDAAALAGIVRRMAPGGMLLLTVPALRSLWSAHDQVNHHFRRYHRAELVELVRRSGLELTYCSYFCTFLLPLIYLGRRIESARPAAGLPREHDLAFGPAWRDGLLERIFRSERHLIPRFRLPLGSSLVAIGRSPTPAAALPSDVPGVR